MNTQQKTQRRLPTPHQVRVYRAGKEYKDWLCADQIAKSTGVSARTVRKHVHLFSKLGIFEKAELFPTYLYRLSDNANSVAYTAELEKASEIMNL